MTQEDLRSIRHQDGEITSSVIAQSKLTTTDIATFGVALKQAYELGDFSLADCKALRSAYMLCKLLEAIMAHAELLDAKAMQAIARFMRLVQNNIAAPKISAASDISFQLDRQLDYGAHDVLGDKFHHETRILYLGFVADFVAHLQSDLLALAVRLRESATPEDDDAKYVIGMIEITASNFGALAEASEDVDLTDFRTIEHFLADGCQFAAAVRRELNTTEHRRA